MISQLVLTIVLKSAKSLFVWKLIHRTIFRIQNAARLLLEGWLWRWKTGHVEKCHVPGPMDVPHWRKRALETQKKINLWPTQTGFKTTIIKRNVDSAIRRLTFAGAKQCMFTDKRPHKLGIGKFGCTKKTGTVRLLASTNFNKNWYIYICFFQSDEKKYAGPKSL